MDNEVLMLLWKPPDLIQSSSVEVKVKRICCRIIVVCQLQCKQFIVSIVVFAHASGSVVHSHHKEAF